MSGDDIVTILEALINVYGAPEFPRMDNDTEMTSNAVADWCSIQCREHQLRLPQITLAERVRVILQRETA